MERKKGRTKGPRQGKRREGKKGLVAETNPER